MNNEELSLALQLINAVRERCGLSRLQEIPKGVAPDSENAISRLCPLAKAIPNTIVASDYIRTSNLETAEALSLSFAEPLQSFVEFPGEFVIDLPKVLTDFIAHYDHYLLPQFIEES
jgi:hypothetical protein